MNGFDLNDSYQGRSEAEYDGSLNAAQGVFLWPLAGTGLWFLGLSWAAGYSPIEWLWDAFVLGFLKLALGA